MHIEISYRGVDRSDALDEHVRGSIEGDLSRFAERITRVEVHVGDENAHKGGAADKRVLLEARPAHMDPLVVEHFGEDLYTTVSEASHKLQRALTHKFERHDAPHQH